MFLDHGGGASSTYTSASVQGRIPQTAHLGSGKRGITVARCACIDVLAGRAPVRLAHRRMDPAAVPAFDSISNGVPYYIFMYI
jgi:hypothetical protein